MQHSCSHHEFVISIIFLTFGSWFTKKPYSIMPWSKGLSCSSCSPALVACHPQSPTLAQAATYPAVLTCGRNGAAQATLAPQLFRCDAPISLVSVLLGTLPALSQLFGVGTNWLLMGVPTLVRRVFCVCTPGTPASTACPLFGTDTA